MRELELLIPARNLDAGMAGVDYGADALYIGGPGFGARGAAGNRVEDIAKLIGYAHPYGVKVYVALNTLLYEEELRQAEKQAKELISAGIDALIVQDTALMMMGLEGVAFHASTQMTNTTSDHVRFLGRAGFSRVVLERGLTINQIAEITAAGGVETECFIHGAICVGHSGRCYLSRSMGPRSGNRGVCGQPCRIKYDLEDGKGNVLIKDKHLLSVRDLNLSGYIGRMIDAGVTSFKVEGRLKETEYVKNITAFYREKLDYEIAKRDDVKRSSEGISSYEFTPDPAKSFSRGFTVWTAYGAKAGSGSFDTPKSLGEPLGKIAETGKGFFILDNKTAVLSSGDGICFMDGGKLQGTNVNKVEAKKIYPNKTDGLKPGTEIFRNYDHRFNTLLGNSRTRRAIQVEIIYAVTEGGLAVTALDMVGNSATANLKGSWESAKDQDRMRQVLETQLAKSGDTVFNIISVAATDTEANIPFIPVSALNGLRREVLEKLNAERVKTFDDKKKHNIAAIIREDSYPYPSDTLGGEGNVTNSLARKFWTMHGVKSITEPFDLRNSLEGKVVMITPYCIRREIGKCLKEINEKPIREFYLRSGDYRYKLGFNCKNCMMTLTKCPVTG